MVGDGDEIHLVGGLRNETAEEETVSGSGAGLKSRPIPEEEEVGSDMSHSCVGASHGLHDG